jgi:hypothetical protein
MTQLQLNRRFNEYFSDLLQIVVLLESLSHTVYTQMSCSDHFRPKEVILSRPLANHITSVMVYYGRACDVIPCHNLDMISRGHEN